MKTWHSHSKYDVIGVDSFVYSFYFSFSTQCTDQALPCPRNKLPVTANSVCQVINVTYGYRLPPTVRRYFASYVTSVRARRFETNRAPHVKFRPVQHSRRGAYRV